MLQENPPQKVSLILIGDELLSGQVQDCNGQVLARELNLRGFSLCSVNIVKDDASQIQQALDQAFQLSSLVFFSGGLGPTDDDITKKTLGEYFDCPIKENSKACQLAKKHYERIDQEWETKHNSYGEIPLGFTPLENPIGLAPGLFFQKDEKTVISLPGVPREFKAMVKKVLDENFVSYDQKKVFFLKTFGIPEEKIFGQWPQLWSDLESFGKVSSLPSQGEVSVQCLPKDKISLSKIQNFIEQKYKETGLLDHVYTYENQTLARSLSQVLIGSGLTLAIAESCTGGLCSSLLTQIPGISSVFKGSVVSYQNEIKENILKVSSEDLKEVGAVSETVALQMARNVKDQFKTNLGLSFTGLLGPEGDGRNPVGTLFVGIVTFKEEKVLYFQKSGSRASLQNRFAKLGIFHLLKSL